MGGIKFIDLKGMQFGRLTVISRVHNDIYQHPRWLCACVCGKSKTVDGACLRGGLTRSCGCLSAELSADRRRRTKGIARPSQVIDLTGNVYGYLRVVKREGRTADSDYLWKCLCERCNTEIDVRGGNLRSGHTKSCGCLQRDMTAAARTTHGMSSHHLYSVWNGMIRRCENPKDAAYADWGGRGIQVCAEWHNKQEFFDWALTHDYADGLQLERTDNDRTDRGYSPENCYFATPRQQSRNKRNTIFLTRNGETKPLVEWSEITGIPQSTMRQRIKAGWSSDDVVSRPLLTSSQAKFVKFPVDEDLCYNLHCLWRPE